jgi:hypothetical protein
VRLWTYRYDDETDDDEDDFAIAPYEPEAEPDAHELPPPEGLPPFSVAFAGWVVTFGVAVAAAVCRPDWMPRLNLPGAVAFVGVLALVPLALGGVLGGLVLAASSLSRRRRSPARDGVWDPALDDNAWTGGGGYDG